MYCGEKIKDESDNEEKVKTILLRCRQCNGELSIDDKQQIMCCPYCGSKEIIIESDTVKAAQIHANAYRDIEFGKQQTAVKMKQMDIDERNREASSDSKKVLWGFLLMLGSFGVFIFSVEFQVLFSGGAQLFILMLCIMMFIAGLRLWKGNRETNRKRK